MEKLNPNALGLTSAIVWLACYALSVILFLIAPGFTVKLLSQLAHADLTIFKKVMTTNSVVVGVIFRLVGGYVLGYAFAWVYNWFIKEQ